MSTITPVAHRRGFAGFGLIGILLVLAIILFLYFGSTGGNKSYMQTVVETKKNSESLGFAIQAQQLAIFVADYMANHNNKPPTTYEEMGAEPSSFRDTWGNPFRFTVNAAAPGVPSALTLLSNGPDGKPGTDDDIAASAGLPY